MFDRIRNLAAKELIQLTRDWLLVIFIIFGPTLELTLLARATSQSLKHLPIVVVDQDGSQTSRQLVTALDNTEDLDVVGRLASPDDVGDWLNRGRAMLAVILPAGLEADLAVGSSQVQLIADGANSMSSGAALNTAVGAINAFSARHLAMDGRPWPTINLPTQIRYNPTLDANYFTLSALLGLVIYQVVLAVSVMGLTRERERGTLEQLLVTPMQRLEVIVGKAAPAFVVAWVDFVLMWAIAVWGFNVPMRGSFALLVGLSLLFIIAEIGWGLTVSALSETQQAAALTIFVLVMVDVLFSGFVLPVERMPGALQVLAQFFPLQHYLFVIRSVMLKGSALSSLWPQALALAGLAVGSIAVAALSLRRQLA